MWYYWLRKRPIVFQPIKIQNYAVLIVLVLHQSESSNFIAYIIRKSINFFLTEHKGRTKTTEGQYSPERLELARLVSSLLYWHSGHACFGLPAFEDKFLLKLASWTIFQYWSFITLYSWR